MQGVVLSIPPPDCECRQAPSGISIDGDGYDEVCSSCVRLGTKSAVSLEAACRGWLARSKCGRVRDHYRFAWIRYYLRNRDIEAARALGYAFSRGGDYAESLAPSAAQIQVRAVPPRVATPALRPLTPSRSPGRRAHVGWPHARWCTRCRSGSASGGSSSTSARTSPTRRAPSAGSLPPSTPPPIPRGRPAAWPTTSRRGPRSSYAPRRRRPRERRRTALDFPRFLAALHIAAYHLVAGVQPRDEMHNAIKWGFTWVPYFFVLSGFVSTLAQAGKDARGGGARFAYCGGDACAWLWKRLVGAYPLFALSCLLAVWRAAAHEWPAGAWVSLVPTLLFLQTWAPDSECTDTVAWCATQPWNEPAWFVSALFFCWLAFPLAYRATARLGGCGAAAAAAALLAVAIFYDAIWWTLAELSNPGCYEGSGDDTEWCYNYFARRRWLEVYLPRHPLISFVKFALGGCLARLTLAGAWSGPLRYAATPAAAGVCALFFATDPDAVFFREAAVLPLFCLLIVGLAEGRDPLARVLQLRVLAWWGRLSYPVYILHTAVAITIKQLTSEPDYSTNVRRYLEGYFPLLIVVALLAHYGVEVPVAAHYRAPPRWWCQTTARSGGAARPIVREMQV